MVTCTRLIALAPSSFGCSVIMASSIGSPWDDSLWLHVLA